MNDFLRKHWITLLGVVFIFLSFSYLFKYAVDQGWITNSIKIGAGLLAGAGFIVLGVTLLQKGKELVSQILTGLGVALLYTTFSFAGIYYDLWTSMTVFLAMLAVTGGLSFFAYRFNLRILMNISILGALIAPCVMKPETDQVFTLFLYLLVINAIFFFLSVRKNWTELRLTSFLGTWLLFCVYYFWFEPETWIKPIRYALAAYVFYVAGFLVSSWKEKLKFDGLNLYLGFVNAVMFGVWSLWILDGIVSYSVPLAGMGIVYVVVAGAIYYLNRSSSTAVLSNLLGGLLLLLISATEIGKGMDIRPIIAVYLWTGIAFAAVLFGEKKQMPYLKLLSVAAWAGVGIYWFFVTWDTPLGLWFGTFIPILNWSGMAWVVLAALGFYYSLKTKFNLPVKEDTLSTCFSIASHLIVGGLLTFQIDNLWEYYSLKFMDLDLTLSISWGIYALLLFVWGAYSKQAVFRWIGSAVLVLVAVKTIFLDLQGADTVYKILVLFILGVISFGISYINNMWKTEKPVPSEVAIAPGAEEGKTLEE